MRFSVFEQKLGSALKYGVTELPRIVWNRSRQLLFAPFQFWGHVQNLDTHWHIYLFSYVFLTFGVDVFGYVVETVIPSIFSILPGMSSDKHTFFSNTYSDRLDLLAPTLKHYFLRPWFALFTLRLTLVSWLIILLMFGVFSLCCYLFKAAMRWQQVLLVWLFYSFPWSFISRFLAALTFAGAVCVISDDSFFLLHSPTQVLDMVIRFSLGFSIILALGDAWFLAVALRHTTNNTWKWSLTVAGVYVVAIALAGTLDLYKLLVTWLPHQ